MIDPGIVQVAAVGVLGVGTLIWRYWPKPFNKLMRTLEIHNSKDKYPHLLDHDVGPRTETFTVWIPDGVSMDLFIDPKSKIHQQIRQSVGDMNRIEVIPINGHKLAIRVITEELAGPYPFTPDVIDNRNPMAFCIGESLDGPVTFTVDNTTPHVVVAGAPGSGKSVCLRGMVAGCMLNPRPVDVWLIDMKGGVEFQMFQKCGRVRGYARTIPEGLEILQSLQAEMIRRNDIFFEANDGINSIDRYNAKHPRDPMPRHVLFIDEFAQFMAKKEKDAQFLLKDLARRARSCGIHMIVATQRPDADVLDGQIRACITGYICFMVSSEPNSRVVLGHGGAEHLPGKGRGILRVPGRKEIEFQGYLLDEDECRIMMEPLYVDRPAPVINTTGVVDSWPSPTATKK